MRRPTENSTAGGALLLIGAQMVFLLSSYALHVVVARLLGPAAYGVYGVVFNILSILFVFVGAGVPQAVARYVGSGVVRPEATRNTALRLQLGASAVIVALYFLGSWPLAALLADPALVPYLQLSSLAIPTYALYALWANYLGGLHQFSRQAAVNGLYGFLKMLCVCLLAYLGGIAGALLGLALSPLATLLAALRLTPREGDSAPGSGIAVSVRELLAFAVPVTLFAASTEAITMLDLFLLKAQGGEELVVGYYTAASTIARVPYFLLIGLGTALLPATARAAAGSDPGRTERLIRQAIRVVVLVAVPAVAFAAITARLLVDFLYSAAYLQAADQLPLLTAGMSLAALFRVCATIEAGAGREKVAMVVAVLALAVGLVAGVPLTSSQGAAGAALTNVLMGAVAGGLALAILLRRYPRALPAATMLRGVAAVLPAFMLARVLGDGVLPTLVAAGLGLVLYPVMLGLLGEVGREDLALVAGLLPDRAKGLLRSRGT